MDLEKLAQLRRELVTARAELREATDAEKLAKAAAEQRAIEHCETAARASDPSHKPGTALGTNEAARDRALTTLLGQDTTYRRALAALWWAQQRVDELTAGVDSLLDQRNERDTSARIKLADALSENAHIRGTFMRADDLGVTAQG